MLGACLNVTNKHGGIMRYIYNVCSIWNLIYGIALPLGSTWDLTIALVDS